MKKTLAIIAILFASLTAWTQTPIVISKQTKTINGKKYYAHVVEKGQTVFSIARAYGVNYREAVYKSDIDKIAIGDTVFLPSNEKAEPAKFRYYVVKQGNTLYSLSKDFQVEIDDILKLNPKIENNNIKVGEVLKIPMEKTLKDKKSPQSASYDEKHHSATELARPAENTSTSAQYKQVKTDKSSEKSVTADAKEKEALEKQQKKAQAKAEKEQQRQQKALEERQAKEQKEIEKQQKEARQKAEKEAKAKAEQLEKEAKAREKAEKEARQKAEKEAKAKAEQLEKEAKAKAKTEQEAREKAEKEARQKAEKEAKSKAEQLENEAKAKAKAEKEARQKAEQDVAQRQTREQKELDKQKKELEQQRKELEKQQKDAAELNKKDQQRLQKESAEKQNKEKQEIENQKKEIEKQRKEIEKQQKELEKQQKELEKQQKELEKQKKETASSSNPKAEYRPINKSTTDHEIAYAGKGNTAQQSDYTNNSPQPAAQPATPKPTPAPAPKSSSTEPSDYHELPLQTAPNIGSSVPAPNVVIRDRISNSSIHITLMMPLSLASIDEISTSKFDIEQRKKRKYKSFAFIQFYEGIMLALDELKNEGCNVVLNVVDIPGDLPDRVEQAFKTQNIAQSDFIIALLEKNAFEKAAQLAMENNVFILNPLSTRPEILDNNPYVVKLYPSYQGIVSSTLSMISKNHTEPNIFLVHSNAKLEKRLFDEFQQQLSAQNKIKYTIFDWSANAKLVNMLKSTSGDNIVVNIYDQTKDKNKTQSNLILNRLFSIKKNTPTLITLPNWASTYEDDIDFSQLQRLNYHFCSNFFLDKNNTKHKDFVTRFKEKYKTEPQGNLAALGNDIIIHFVSGIKAKGTAKFWQDPNTDRRKNMNYHFHFKRSAPDKGFENQNAYFYKLNAKYQFQPAN